MSAAEPRPRAIAAGAGGVLAFAGVALTLALAGCGESELTFTAEEFVAEANARGAGLVLGPPLDTDRAETTIYELSVEQPSGAGAAAHGGGSLTVLADAEAGLAEYERCDRGVSLICFSAANIALIFDGNLAPAEISRVGEALLSMASS